MTALNPTTPSTARHYTAVDLGASSGRVMLGSVGAGGIELTEVHRFANHPVALADGLHWDITRLYDEVLTGLHRVRSARPRSLGVDSWAVDYGLLGADGALLGPPFCYRDSRTDGVSDAVVARVGARRLYEGTGVRPLPFNTAFQLAAAGSSLADAATLLLIPDLIGYWLTGEVGAERTNASTTQLCLPGGDWNDALVAEFGIDRALLPPIAEPGSVLGRLHPHVRDETGLGPDVSVVRVASHDTASAVAAVPVASDYFAYISCGTWSLAGLELAAPVLTEASRKAGFTNETGVDGTIRFLRNVMGLWLLQECQRVWQISDVSELLAQAAAAPRFRSLIDPDHPSFAAPGDLPARIDAYCGRTGQPVPRGTGEYVRTILESLALAHREAIRTAARVAGRIVDVVHLVGGGARNPLLCQWTADACDLPVLAGPAEATALGNIALQARADGRVGSLDEIRALTARSTLPRRYDPASTSAWDAAAARFATLKESS